MQQPHTAPDTPSWVRGYRVAAALLALLAIGYQGWYSTTVRHFPLAHFLSFFTIQSNLFAVAVLLWGTGSTIASRSPRALALVRGAAVLYLAVTGIVYGVLLAGYQEELQTTIPWVDTVLHRLMPLVLVADWLLVPPRVALTVRQGLIWLGYPLLYVVYTLVHGPRVGWYPYPFLDPAVVGGYGVVGVYCIGITVGIGISMWTVVRVGNWMRRDTTLGTAA